MMRVWFECKEDNVLIGLDTDTKPSVGDSLLVKNTKYDITEVLWLLEEYPGQSGIIVYMKRRENEK